jgi:hypothetical protein
VAEEAAVASRREVGMVQDPMCTARDPVHLPDRLSGLLRVVGAAGTAAGPTTLTHPDRAHDPRGQDEKRLADTATTMRDVAGVSIAMASEADPVVEDVVPDEL